MPHRKIAFSIISSIIAARLMSAGRDLQRGDDTDLTHFVTRPEIQAPIYEVSHRSEQGITPGYWFVAPYANVLQERAAHNYYQPCSTGPLIYDGDGQLVWSGACKWRNANACDFRAFQDEEGNDYLSTLILGYEPDTTNVGAIMDSSYELVHNLSTPLAETKFNMHEWKVIEQGRSVVYLTYKHRYADLTYMDWDNASTGWTSLVGFRELDVATGAIKFDWVSEGHINETETTALPPKWDELIGPSPNGWNWFHPNSVDKDTAGDYLLSGRFTDTVYKVGSNGQVLWRLGGVYSSFKLEGFNFSKQHDARFIGNDGDVEIISLFDNGKAHHPGLHIAASSNQSTALVIALDKMTMTAKPLRQYARPDGEMTALRGNFQLLQGGNAFVCWSGDGYITEHSRDGNLLLEARFASKRFVTYRGYKFNFTGKPTEPPVLKAIVYGTSPESSSTVWYTSWNGATEVSEWRYYRVGNFSDGGSCIGSTKKTGFETSFASEGYERFVFAEAIAANGTTLGRTETQELTLPISWNMINHAKALDDLSGPHLANVKITQLFDKDEL